MKTDVRIRRSVANCVRSAATEGTKLACAGWKIATLAGPGGLNRSNGGHEAGLRRLELGGDLVEYFHR